MSHFAMLSIGLEEGQVLNGATVPEVQLEVEQNTAQLTDTAQQVEQAAAAMEEAVAAVDAIDDQAQVLEQGVESGEGVAPETAVAVECAVNAYAVRLGIKRAGTFSRENFGSRNGRLAATKLSLEDIGDTIRSIFERIKAIALRVWEKIKSFILGLFKSTQAMDKHLQSLKDRVMKLDDSMTPDKTELDNESLAKVFSVNKTANKTTAETILTHSTALLEGRIILSKETRTAVNSITGVFRTSGDPDKTKIAEQIRAIGDSVASRMDGAFAKAGEIGGAIERKKEDADKDADVSYYGPLAGCRVIARKLKKEEIAGEKVVTFGLSMITYDHIAADKITALRKDEMVALLTKATALLDALDGVKKSQSNVEDIQKQLDSAADAALAKLKSAAESDTELNRLYRKVGSQMAEVNGVLATLGLSIPNAVYAAVKGVGDYVSASIANMKKK